MVWSSTSNPARLIVAGILVVGLSIGGSLAATHTMFQIDGTIHYSDAMLVAFCIPALVAPPSFLYYVWVARRMEQLNAQLDRLARQDPLTGLDNRRAFVERAAVRISDRSAHILAMIDLDHFKRINDSLGHAGGDLALQHAAAVISSAAPPDTLVARLGGEEFGLMFVLEPGERAREAGEAVVDAIRLRLEGLPLITPAGVTRMTASFGIAISRADESLDHLLCRADNALYAAKNAGRNRLAVAS